LGKSIGEFHEDLRGPAPHNYTILLFADTNSAEPPRADSHDHDRQGMKAFLAQLQPAEQTKSISFKIQLLLNNQPTCLRQVVEFEHAIVPQHLMEPDKQYFNCPRPAFEYCFLREDPARYFRHFAEERIAYIPFDSREKGDVVQKFEEARRVNRKLDAPEDKAAPNEDVEEIKKFFLEKM